MEIISLSGVSAYLCTSLLCLTLHPSISSLMSRRERTLALSALSWTSLILSTVHAVMADWETLATIKCLPSTHQISILLPVLTIFMQVVLVNVHEIKSRIT